MKFLPLPFAAAVLLFASCNSEPPQRGDAMSIDNPTDADYFIIVDEDTLPLPAHTYIQGFTPICTGEENITYESGHNPGVHRYRVLDANKKQIFDTSFQSRYRHLIINPTRSTYVEWSVLYGDSIPNYQLDSMLIDGIVYYGTFAKYSSFAIMSESQKDLKCERAIAMSVMQYKTMDDEISKYMPDGSREYYFYRLQDFLIAYNETGSISEKEEAEVLLNNLLNSFYERTVEDWTHPFRNGEVEQLGNYIRTNQLDRSVNLINVYSDFFGKHDADGVKELNRLNEIAKSTTTRTDPFFKAMRIVKYDYDTNGKPYISETSEYDTKTGECTITAHSAPLPE